MTKIQAFTLHFANNIELTSCARCNIIITVKETLNEYRASEKGDQMEENMTDRQYEGMLQMILMILDGCKDLEEAKGKVKELLKNKQ